MGVSDIWSSQVPHEKRHYSAMWKSKNSEKQSEFFWRKQYNIQDSIENAKHILKSWIGVQLILRILWMTNDV